MDDKWNEQLINELRESTSDLLVGPQRENFGDFQQGGVISPCWIVANTQNYNIT